KLKRDRRAPNERSMGELYDLVSRGEKTGAEIKNYKVDMHMKFSFYFAAFVLSLIGLKFGYRSERSTETALWTLLALGLGVLYFFMINAASALARQDYLPVVLGAWMANIIVFSIVSVVLWR